MTHRIYTASKVFRAPMWWKLRNSYPTLEFTSHWIDHHSLDDESAAECRAAWVKNIDDVCRSTHLVCYGEKNDTLSGTIVEVGAALATGIPVYLIGDFDWKTWRHHPLVTIVNLPFLEPINRVAAVLDRIQRDK